jgi:hypothetical protein
MTTIGSTNSALSYLNAYGNSASTGSGSTAKTDTASTQTSSSSATVVTLSAAAQAALSAQTTLADFATVVSDTRAALDALYKEKGVKGPIREDGQQVVYFDQLDRRQLFAIATNGGQQFSVDEQNLAKKELQARLDEVLKPQAAVARITGDWSRTYQAAIDYLQEQAGPEEKASATFAGQLDALQKGYDTAVKAGGALPKGIAGDPVAEYLSRTQDGTDDGATRNFTSVADDVRAALDAQIKAASDKGKELVFDSSRRTGQLVDFSTFDNRSLSAISLNEGKQFAVDEVRAAKKELDTRTRTSLLNSLQSGDPRDFSVGLIQQYESMSTEERQAMNWTNDFRDMAIKNYQTSSSLLSMFQQTTGGSSLASYFG